MNPETTLGAAVQVHSMLPAAPFLFSMLAGVLMMFPLQRAAKVSASLTAALLVVAFSVGMLVQTIDGNVLVHSMGAWPAPFGIVLVADGLSAFMSLLSAVVFFFSVAHVAVTPDKIREKFHLFALMQFLHAGVQLSFLTGDLFNLFVAFEIMLVASYALAVLGSTREQLREGFRYIVMNLVASALLVTTCGFIYGALGTLNMAHLAQRAAEIGPHSTIALFSSLLLIVFASKSAQFPFGFWLAGTYPALPAAVGAFFAAILTKVGIYALIRTFGTMFTADVHIAQTVLITLGIFSMLFGAFGLVSQREWRRILAFGVISSVGYMAFGLGIGTPEALSATLFYTATSVMVTSSLFLLASWAEKTAGTSYVAVRGMLEKQPLMAAIFLLGALTLAGLPPTAGFIAKFGLISAAVAQPTPLVWAGVAAALLASLVILYAMLQLWRGYFWGKRAIDCKGVGVTVPERRVTILAAAPVVLAALFASPLASATDAIALQMANPSFYIGGVLGDKPVIIPPMPAAGDDVPSAGESEGHDHEEETEHSEEQP